MIISNKLKAVLLSDIKPYKNNIKIHTEEQIEKIKKSIENNEYIQPICVDKKNIIVIGHGRYFALRKINPDMEIEVVKLDDLSIDKINKLRILDNKLNESEWSFENLETEIKRIYLDLDSNIDKIVSEIDMNRKFIRDIVLRDKYANKDGEEDFNPNTGKRIIKKDDIIELGHHHLLCGDATKKEDVDKLMNGNKADMVFTDLPYNVAYDQSRNRKIKKYKKTKLEKIKNDNMALDKFKLLLTKSLVNNHNKNGTVYYVCMGTLFLHILRDILDKNGFHFSNYIIWLKNNFTMMRSGYHRRYEPIYYGWFGTKALKQIEDRTQDDVWHIDIVKDSTGSGHGYTHPTQKPVLLAERAILNSSRQNSIIYDPFMGSATTLIASEKTGRICYGMELDEHYCDVIIERYCQYSENFNIKINGKKVNWRNVKK